ncbi:MAG: glycosyltransferase family 2 protein [Bacteroidaceae bacterium]|nr:glycosyltransferase family 2 protein [Bacteroidaceae bacterium]
MLTVSIVTYKTPIPELEKCFESLQSEVVNKIFVIDNSSKDYLKDYCKTKHKVEYIASKNIGYGAAHNIAIRKAIEFGSTYHLVLNSDVYFEPNALHQLIAYMEERNDVAMVQPNIIYPDGSMQYTCRLLPTPADLIFRRFLPKKMAESMNYKYLLKMFDHKSELNVPYHQGSFLFFRTSCFDKVGLFDERFFMYPEDIDITRRMHREYRTMFWPGVTVVHAHRAASYKSNRMLYIHTWNMIKYLNKWGWIFDGERRKWNKLLLEELDNKIV